MRVLLLEPDHSFAKIVSEALAQDGHSIVWCSGADTALTELDRKNVDAILVEIQLAKHNGIEFLYEIRSYPDLAKIPVILLTMIAEIDLQIDDSTKQQLGIYRYLYKPTTSLRKLAAVIKQIA